MFFSTFHVFGSGFRTLAVILFSFLFFSFFLSLLMRRGKRTVIILVKGLEPQYSYFGQTDSNTERFKKIYIYILSAFVFRNNFVFERLFLSNV